MWLAALLSELLGAPDKPPLLKVDNKSAIGLITNPASTSSFTITLFEPGASNEVRTKWCISIKKVMEAHGVGGE
jgi:hypothetical protein